MTAKASTIKGLQVFSLSQSKNISKAQDVVYNPETKKVEAVLINKSGMLSEGKAILINDVKSIGKDAIVVESDQSIKKESELPANIMQLVKNNEGLPKSKVMTESGVNLGTISDLLFDPNSGMVEEFEVSQGPLKDVQSGKKTIKVGDIVSMNKEMTVVKTAAESEVQQQSQEKGVSGAVSKVSSTIKQKTQEIKENPKVQEMTQKISEKKKEPEQTPEQPPKPPSTPQNQQPPVEEPPQDKIDETVEDLKEEGIEIRNEKPSGTSENLDKQQK